MLNSIGKVEALMSGITRDDIERMPKAHRQRFAQALRRAADLADPSKPEPPKAGVLADLRNGERME